MNLYSCGYDRIAAFLETQVKMYPVTLTWVKENIPHFKLFKENFVKAEGYEQAEVMHDGCAQSDKESKAFYNYQKLSGNPLLIELKDTYTEDDLIGMCYKIDYPIGEALEFCFNISEKKFFAEQAALSSAAKEKKG